MKALDLKPIDADETLLRANRLSNVFFELPDKDVLHPDRDRLLIDKEVGHRGGDHVGAVRCERSIDR